MLPAIGYAAVKAGAPLEPFMFSRRALGPYDVRIQIRYCGICHSDVHQARDEWGDALFPMVPGHEIIGTVIEVGASVSRFAVGDTAGVGCMVDSCRQCSPCRSDLEQYCDTHVSWTYNGTEQDRRTPTFGGYADHIVVDERYVLRIPTSLPLDGAAPLLCAGITMYSPLAHWNVGPGQRLAVVGLGGLGHMAVKLGALLGAEVTVLSHSDRKRGDARRLGAADFASTTDTQTFKRFARRFDVLLDTVSAEHRYDPYLELLKTDGTMILVGVPERASPLGASPLIMRRRRLVGSLIGGIAETQAMLDLCAEHRMTADVEVIPIHAVNDAFERMLRGDVRYRFVIDMRSLG